MMMPREPREHIADAILHLIARGVEGKDLFRDDRDRRFFMRTLRAAFDLHRVRLLTDCLMTNHLHLLASPSDVPIGVAMHLLQTTYARYFNDRYGRVGYLFQGRYLSIPVRESRHLLTVADYITDNPVRAGLVARRDQWAWSSHSELLGDKRGLLSLEALPEIARQSRDEFIALYRERARKVFEPANLTMEQMVDRAAALTGLTVDELLAGGRGAAFTLARRHVQRWGSAAGFTTPEIARVLGCTPEALYKQGWRFERAGRTAVPG